MIGIYGSTETGYIASILYENNETLKFCNYLNYKLLSYDGKIKEVVIDINENSLSNINNKKENDRYYFTGDLVKENDNGEYVLLGRKDDLIVHVNGEKTNPIPIDVSISI